MLWVDVRRQEEISAEAGKRKAGGWRRPSLPGAYAPSTIGAGGLNGRVREGTGCTPTARVTNRLRGKNGWSIARTRERQLLRSTGDKPSTISTGWLKTLRSVHRPPIQLVVYQRSYPVIR